MSNILLGVTGSVAAVRTPRLFASLREAGHAVKVVATSAAIYFFDPLELDPTRTERNPDILVLDEDEWPGRSAGQRWRRDDAVLHIELRRWADLLLIAPLDANTLAKLANGLADNCLTCVWRAWDGSRPVVLAPAMNTQMWEHRLTVEHLQAIAAWTDIGQLGASATPEGIVEAINETSSRLRIVPPISKRLACGDIGVGGLADVTDIVQVVHQSLAR